MKEITEETLAWIKETIGDFKYFCERVLSISDKNGKVIPFKLNKIQERLVLEIESAKLAGKKLRFLVLKARQEGVSTFFCAYIYKEALTNRNYKAGIIGHLKDASANLFTIIKRYHSLSIMPLKPSIGRNNQKNFVFDKIGSIIRVFTAGTKDKTGRSDTLNALLATEVGFWENAEKVLIAIKNTLAPDALEILESTANGTGGYFHKLWIEAMEGKNDYIPLFFAWHEFPDYSQDFTNEYERKRFIDSLTEDEKKRIELYNLTYEQANWYRDKLKSGCNGDRRLMNQEYPSNPVEAFISTGSPYFDAEECNYNYIKALEYEDSDGYLEFNNTIGSNQRLIEKNVVFIPQRQGEYRFYNEPEHRGYINRYSAGVDVAEGLEQGDYSTIAVLDRIKQKIVLEYRAHVDPDLLVDEIEKVQLLYKNDIYFAIEKNNHGRLVVSESYKRGINMYYNQTFEKGYPEDGQSFGIFTLYDNKKYMLDHLRKRIREKTLITTSKWFWKETNTFVTNAKGRPQAQGKDTNPGTPCFDDMIMAYCFAIECDLWMPSPFAQVPAVKNYRSGMNNNYDLTTF